MPATTGEAALPPPLPPFLFDPDFPDLEFFPTNPSNPPTLSDDDWGDFVENPNSTHQTSPEALKKTWERPAGALPLSLFGEEEVEEVDLEEEESKDQIFGGFKRGGDGVGVGKGEIKDLIADLYGKAEKNGGGEGLESGGGVDEEDEGDGWEFKDAVSDFGSGNGSQVLENGLGLNHQQSFLPVTLPSKGDNGNVDAPQNAYVDFFAEASRADSISKGDHEANHVNLESYSNSVVANGVNSHLPDLFSSSLLIEDKSQSSLGAGDTEDLFAGLFAARTPDGGNRQTVSPSNGVIHDVGPSNLNDDEFDAWEFKDAVVESKPEPQVEVVVNNTEDNITQGSISGVCNDKQDVAGTDPVPDLFDKVPDLFSVVPPEPKTISRAYDAERVNFENGVDSNLAAQDTKFPAGNIFSSTPLHVKNNSPLNGGNIKDLLYDLYGQADAHSGDRIGNHDSDPSNDLGANDHENDDFDDSSWEFKDALSDMQGGDKVSYQDQDSSKLWENDVEKPSKPAVTNEKQGPDNSHINHSVESTSLDAAMDSSDLSLTTSNDDFGLFMDFNCKENMNLQNSAEVIKVNESKWDLEADLLDNRFNQPTGSADTQEVAKDGQEDIMDFYSKLKEVSHFLIFHHLDNLKKAHEITALTDENEAAEMYEEIQTAYARLGGNADFHADIFPDQGFSKDVSVVEFLGSMKKQPYSEALEMEVFLSEKISLAERDLDSAIHLLEHSSLILRLLDVLSREERRAYIIHWFKIFSACARELQHGAMIWAQCLNANVHNQILTEKQGCKYFLSLGQIHLVAKILSVSIAVYKPWLLLNATESEQLFIIAKRCSKIWSDSGLLKAVEGIVELANPIEKEIVRSVIESINTIQNADISALQIQVEGCRGRICLLSLLPLETLQGMQSVMWNGKSYFLKLANLWVNLISCDPPVLPHVNVG